MSHPPPTYLDYHVLQRPADLAVDDTHVYWINQVDEFGSVRRVAK